MADTPSVDSCGSENKDDERRKQIRAIMADPKLSGAEKSRAVQNLMNPGRRSSMASQTASVASQSSDHFSYVSNMARAARQAAEYYSGSDDEGDAVMSEFGDDSMSGHPGDVEYEYNDYRSVASSVTHVFDFGEVVGGNRNSAEQPRSQSLQDWNETSRARAAAQASALFRDHPAHVSRLMEQSRPKCEHYDRNCTLVSPCCGLAFGCRICHDECPVLPPPMNFEERFTTAAAAPPTGKKERRRSMPLDWGSDEEEENHHAFDRFAVKEIICRQCYVRQPSKT